MQSSRKKKKKREANYFANYTNDEKHLRAHCGCGNVVVVVIEKLKTIITAEPFSS